jgi:uncharacterized protein YnzC (UPF0291/DUF896 family)
MEQSKIDRINELARKKKAEGLTPTEIEEQAALRAEYIAGFRASLTAQLENTVMVDPDGTKHKIEKKNKPS